MAPAVYHIGLPARGQQTPEKWQQVDADIDFSADQKVLYAAASVTATLTIAEVSDDGKFHVKALIPTAREARGVIATKGKTAYLIDPAEGRILKLSHR